MEGVQGIYGGQTTHGTLRLTDFHMVFSAPIDQSTVTLPRDLSAPPPKVRERWITFPMLSYCALRPVPPGSRQAPSIRIRCRDFTFVTFNFTDNDAARETFDFIKSPEPSEVARGFGTAALLLVLVLVLFLLARAVGGRGPGRPTRRQARQAAKRSQRDVVRMARDPRPPNAFATADPASSTTSPRSFS